MTQPALVIEELGVPDAIRVELAGDDAPHGRRYEAVMTEEGGPVQLGEEDGTRLPGRPRPLYQVLFAKFRPRIYKGAFRDRLMGRPGHAKAQKHLLERLRLRVNPVRVTRGEDSFEGLLVDANFGVEDPDSGDVRYELHFSVSEVAGLSDPETEAPTHPQAGPDLVAQLQADMAALRAAQQQLAVRAAVGQVLAVAWSALDDALTTAADAVALLESGTVGKAQQARAAIQRTIAGAQVVSDKAKALANSVRQLSADDILEEFSAANLATFEANRSAILREMLAMRDAMRSIEMAARAKLYVTTRLYRVRDGDTLDSVARATLGSRGRADDLGLTQAQLAARVGHFIRISAA